MPRGCSTPSTYPARSCSTIPSATSPAWLADIFICSINKESWELRQNYIKLLSDIPHMEILIVCMATLVIPRAIYSVYSRRVARVHRRCASDPLQVHLRARVATLDGPNKHGEVQLTSYPAEGIYIYDRIAQPPDVRFNQLRVIN
ncbi:hypothetical protein Taro_046283 [Colocasia esculenta]|uniref:Uncharacterized protein n=1 Tax=Colocasia esculenta TaxID=4460 RepID=A0A843X5D9_COLES|nr:hypothetical protein [Colocasia esculenta]